MTTGRLRALLSLLRRDTSGQTLVEFSITSIILIMLSLAVIEMGRLVLVYTTVANAARAGARYAITNSSPPVLSSAPSASTYTSAICQRVIGFMAAAPLNTSRLSCGTNITINYYSPGSTTVCSTCTTPGNVVSVTVAYPYDPILSYFRLPSLTPTSTSRGVITW